MLPKRARSAKSRLGPLWMGILRVVLATPMPMVVTAVGRTYLPWGASVRTAKSYRWNEALQQSANSPRPTVARQRAGIARD